MAKTYDTYKDSGSVWVGDIPSEWNIGNFRYFGEFTKGKLPSTTNTEGKGLPIIGASEMLGKECRTFSEDANVPQCSNDDILILWDGANAGIISSHHKGIVSSTAVKYHCSNSDVNKNFLYYFLKSVEPNFKEKVNGTTIPHMNMKYINEIPLLMPPLSVQQSISSFLDTKCGEIDSLISIQEEMISELLAYKQSVITEAVTKGLDKKAKMKNSGVKWIGDIPEEWEVIKIQYLNQGLTDGTHGTYNRVDKGRLLLSSKNVREKDLLITDSESQISEEDYQSIISNGFPKKGDLLMCCIGASIGRCIIYKYDETYAFQRSVIFIRCNKLIKPELLRYNLLSNNSLLQELFLINQSAQAGLYQGQVKEIKVIVPPISKQKQIIDYLDEKTFQIDSLIALKQSKIESLKEYKKSIIYEYVTGKKRV